MSTINNPQIIRDLINKGPETDDIKKIYRYYSMLAKKRIFAIYNSENYQLIQSEFVASPEVLWTKSRGLTEAGRKFMEEQSGEGEDTEPTPPTPSAA